MTKCACLSTISRKQLMAVAGLGLCLFVLSHVIGNFLIFVGADAYNTYSHNLTSNPLIYVAEAGLVGIFMLHLVSGIVVTIGNRRARQHAYAQVASGDKATSKTSKSMWWQGVVILVFVVLHLWTFKYGEVYETTVDGVLMRDIFRLVIEVFQQPIYVVGYVFAVGILGFHLGHGFYSSLQTLGINHPRYTPIFKKVSIVYGSFIGLGFIAQPIYMFLFYKG